MHPSFFAKNITSKNITGTFLFVLFIFTAQILSGFCATLVFAQAPAVPALPPMNTSGSPIRSTSGTAPVQTPAQASAQVQTTSASQSSLDTQLPWDENGSVFVYTSEMEAAFAIFPSFANLIEARLFQARDSSYTLEVVQFLSGTQQRTRLPLAPQEAQDLRSRITSAVQNTGMQGRSEVYLTEWEKISFALNAGLVGLSYGFLADVTAAGSQSNSAGSALTFNTAGTILTPILFGGATFWATQQPWFTRSSALMISSGLGTGLLHGFALAGLVTDFRGVTGTPLLLTAIGVGVAEAGLGMRLPEQLGMNYGQTQLMTSMGASGLLAGILAPAAFGVFDRTSANNGEFLIRALSASVLGVSAGGYFLGYKLGQAQHFAGGDGTVMSLPSGITGLLPLGTWFLGIRFGGASDPSELKVIAGLTVLADAGGYWLGHELIRNKDFTFEQGRNIASAAAWGTLAGAIVLLGDRSGEAIRYYPLATAVATGIGFGIGYASNAAQAALNHTSRLSATGAQSLLGDDVDGNAASGASADAAQTSRSWFDHALRNTDVQVSPLGALGIAGTSVVPGSLGGLMGQIALPIVNLRYTFGKSEQESTEEQRKIVESAMAR